MKISAIYCILMTVFLYKIPSTKIKHLKQVLGVTNICVAHCCCCGWWASVTRLLRLILCYNWLFLDKQRGVDSRIHQPINAHLSNYQHWCQVLFSICDYSSSGYGIWYSPFLPLTAKYLKKYSIVQCSFMNIIMDI